MAVLPDLGMLPAEDLGVEKAVLFTRGGLGVCLAANLDALATCDRDVFGLKGLVERVEVQRWWHFKPTIYSPLSGYQEPTQDQTTTWTCPWTRRCCSPMGRCSRFCMSSVQTRSGCRAGSSTPRRQQQALA